MLFVHKPSYLIHGLDVLLRDVPLAFNTEQIHNVGLNLRQYHRRVVVALLRVNDAVIDVLSILIADIKEPQRIIEGGGFRIRVIRFEVRRAQLAFVFPQAERERRATSRCSV